MQVSPSPGATQSSAEASPPGQKAIALAGAGAGGGGGDTLEDPVEEVFVDESEWVENIVEFTDPRNGETYNIIDGRVLISMLNPAPPLVLDPNYFDDDESGMEPSPEIYPGYPNGYPPVLDDPRVQQFLEETEAIPFTEWLSVRAFGVFLPESITVEDAVANWPEEYSEFIEVVDPDGVFEFAYFPTDPPNDYYAREDRRYWSWALWGAPEYPYGMNVMGAWRRGALGSIKGKIALMDTGVQRTYGALVYEDFRRQLTDYGVNVGSKTSHTEFGYHGGEGWASVRNKSFYSAQAYGHGQMSAGTIGADVNNDPDSQLGGYNDVAGMMPTAMIFPVAQKYHGDRAPDSSTFNCALEAVGAVKRVYHPGWLYPGKYVPRYNIEIATAMMGNTWLSEPTKRHLDRLKPYIFFAFPAGNENSTRKMYPAAWPGCYAIAAYTVNGTRASYSNYGSWIFVAGPTEFMSTDPIGNTGYPYYYTLGYTNASHQTCGFSGTCQATAAVVGVAGLVMNYYPNWYLTPLQLAERLSDATVPLPNAPELPGRLDAVAAVFGD